MERRTLCEHDENDWHRESTVTAVAGILLLGNAPGFLDVVPAKRLVRKPELGHFQPDRSSFPNSGEVRAFAWLELGEDPAGDQRAALRKCIKQFIFDLFLYPVGAAHVAFAALALRNFTVARNQQACAIKS